MNNILTKNDNPDWSRKKDRAETKFQEIKLHCNFRVLKKILLMEKRGVSRGMMKKDMRETEVGKRKNKRIDQKSQKKSNQS